MKNKLLLFLGVFVFTTITKAQQKTYCNPIKYRLRLYAYSEFL